MTFNERLLALRQSMKIHNLAAYIVPSSDPHQSEYVAEHWQMRQWIASFTGSMGYVVVTHSEAAVWTDTRYFLQCESETKNTEFKLHKQGIQGAPEHIDWLCKILPKGSLVGCDSSLFSVDQIRSMQKSFDKKNISLVKNKDLIAPIWSNRPALLKNEIFEHDAKYAGKTRTEKLTEIRRKMIEKGADYHLVTTLDDIGWTLNLRGSDVECNPVFVAYMVIGLEKTWLFIDNQKVPTDLKASLNHDNIFIKKYDSVTTFLTQLSDNQSIVVDTSNANFEIYNAIKQAVIIENPTFSIAMKAVKNETEIGFIREVMVKDGVALLKAFRWLEKTLDERPVSEYEMASMIAQYRSDQPLYFGESFSAIIGYEDNGAINHYHPSPENSSMIHKKGILLMDSGGQYQDGTTDITRTIALGEPTAEQKRNFTLVLRGHIALAKIKFPYGTKGIQLDTLARMYLWQHGLNYGHGTGHGVGFFMNVHEPPQGFTPNLNERGKTVLEAGSYSSNEPGFYQDGAYGMRIENLMITQYAEKNEFAQFLDFETVTLFPIDLNLIDPAVLGEDSAWLNAYHARVYERLSVHLDDAEKAWLKAQCRAI
jgi:Xaa-Pro aminopeptidase